MGRVRRCDSRCHRARGTRCKCWCGGFYHGSAGAVNREALGLAVTGTDWSQVLSQHGFKEGETAYIEQKELPLEVS
ncbi:MAG: hypothetical protein PHQ43_03755 [Dehalococcoidales bacterium]|nr:hypothetical protein [Dehalococcoidales bacterium]